MPLLSLRRPSTAAENQTPAGAALETGAGQPGRLMLGGWVPLESDVMQRLQNQSPVEREVQGNVGLGHLFRNCWEGQKGNRITSSPGSDRESCFLPQSSRGRVELSSSKETPIAVAVTIQVGDESCWHTLSLRLEIEWGEKPSGGTCQPGDHLTVLSASCPHCRGLSPGCIPGPEGLLPAWTPWPPSPLLLTPSQANPEAPKIPKTLATLIVTSIPLPLEHGVQLRGYMPVFFFLLLNIWVWGLNYLDQQTVT